MTNVSFGYRLPFQACSAPSHCDFYGAMFVTGLLAVAGQLSPCPIQEYDQIQSSVVLNRLMSQRAPNLRASFVSKWVLDASRHFQLVSSHQITSETAPSDYMTKIGIWNWQRYRHWCLRWIRWTSFFFHY